MVRFEKSKMADKMAAIFIENACTSLNKLIKHVFVLFSAPIATYESKYL